MAIESGLKQDKTEAIKSKQERKKDKNMNEIASKSQNGREF